MSGPDPIAIARAEAIARITAPGAPFEIRVEAVPAQAGRGEPLEVYANRQRSLGELVGASARFGGAEYLVTERGRLTFAEHYAAVTALAGALHDEFAVRKGDRVAICADNNAGLAAFRPILSILH